MKSASADRVTAAAAELYGCEPGEFTDRRKALATAAREAGDAAAAKQIAALRKPTRAAWVVNRLTRADPDAPGRVAALADGLRAAGQAKDGPRLRELSARRGKLIDELTDSALAAAGVGEPPAGLREDVAATLTAALADRDVAAQFAAGTLTRAAQWAGFGLPPAAGGPEEAELPEPAPAGQPGPLAERAEPPPDRPAPPPEDRNESRRPAPRLARRRAASPRHSTTPAPPPAQAGEEAAARRRRAFEDAERTVASATQAASSAAAEEDRLEAEVRELEQRLTRARSKLADARSRARRAEAGERKARQALARLSHP